MERNYIFFLDFRASQTIMMMMMMMRHLVQAPPLGETEGIWCSWLPDRVSLLGRLSPGPFTGPQWGYQGARPFKRVFKQEARQTTKANIRKSNKVTAVPNSIPSRDELA